MEPFLHVLNQQGGQSHKFTSVLVGGARNTKFGAKENNNSSLFWLKPTLSHFIEEIQKPFSWYWFFSTNRLGIFEYSCFISQLYPWRRNHNFIFVMRSCQSNIDSSPKSNTGTSICRSKPRGSWESKMKWQQQEGPRGRTVWTKMLTRYWVGRHRMKTVSSYMTNSPTGIQCMNLHGRRVFGAAAAAAAASWQRIERNSTWCLQTVEEVLHWRGPVFHRAGV